jgi:tetratricopeptide (TPR) repeat protein
MGRYEESEFLYRKSLSIAEKKLGSDHPETSITINNLASVLDRLEKYEEAETLFRKALSIREETW